MKRPTLRWCAAPLVVCLALGAVGCGTVGKKDGAEGSATPEAGAEAGAKPDGAPEAADPKKKPEAETPSEKPAAAKDETPADPAAAEEFKGLPKGEAEFILACRALAAGGKATMTGKDGFVFATDGLAALGANSKTGTPRHQAMVAAITAYAEKLRAAGVELVIAPVPPKPVIYPDFLGTEPVVKDRRYAAYLPLLAAELEKAGVRVADATKALRSDRFNKGGASFPRTGLVWSPAAVATTARAVQAAAKKSAAVKSLARDKTIVSRDAALTQNGETFRARSVGWAQGDRLVPATVAKEGAPILVVGDDHAAAHRSEGVNASLADQLSLAFGTPVETRATPGLGWNEAAAMFTPSADSPTKLVVWCFSAAQFLDSPPPAPKKPAARPARRGGRSADRDGSLPAPPPPDAGSGLRLRDDPGLEARPE